MYNFRLPHLRFKLKKTIILFTTAIQISQPVFAQTVPAANQLPTGGQVVVGAAGISQSGVNMNITQTTNRAAINWQSFDIGSSASVNFDQPSSNSVALNRVLSGNPSQIFGHLTANGQVFLTNSSGVYFAPGSSVNVGALVATTHNISDTDFMVGNNHFTRDDATGSVINEGSITANLGGYVALLAPEVRNNGVIVAQMGTVALAAGEAYELKFNGQGGLADITVTKGSIAALVENKQAIQAPGGLVILSAQAANHLQGGVVKNSGTIEATGMVSEGGVVRLEASDSIELGGNINVDAKTGSSGKGGKVTAISSLDNPDSNLEFSGNISARGGDEGGDGGFIETSASNITINTNARVNTLATSGKTGKWLIDPNNYTIDATAASNIVTALTTSNVEVATSASNASYGSTGAGAGNITVTSAISSASLNSLTLTADNAITVSATITTGSLILTGPGGITLNNNLTTTTDMTLNGNVTLGADITLTSGVSNTYNSDGTFVVPVGVSSVTVTLVGGVGGNGGDDGSHLGGDQDTLIGNVASLTASFAVTNGESLYVGLGGGGGAGGNSVQNTGSGTAGTNSLLSAVNGGAGGIAGRTGTSGGGGGGGAATILTLTNAPTGSSAMLIAAGGGGGGGSGNNNSCPAQCADQIGANYQASSMTGQTGYNYNASNTGSALTDGGGSGGGGGGLLGGLSNYPIAQNEWVGRGGNVGSSGAANGFTTTSLSTSVITGTSGAAGSAIISYGGGAVTINGTVNGSHGLVISAPSGSVNITGGVGSGANLSSLNISGSQGISLGGGAVTTTGAQTFTGPTTLNANSTTFTTTNSAVTFGGNISKGSSVSSNIIVNTGSGAVNFNGQTGTSGTPIGSVSITSTGTTSIAGALYASSLIKLGTGKTTVSGGLIQTSGAQSYADIFDMGGNTTLTSTGTGDITLSKAVSNSNQSNLTINAANGNVTIVGNLATGTNDIPTPIGDVSVTTNGIFTLGTSGTPINGEAKSLSVTAGTSTIYASTNSFTNISNVSVKGINLTTSASFNVTSASTVSGPLSGAMSLTKSGAAKLTLTGTNTYTGNTTVSAGILEIGGAGKLGNGTYNGNINVTGQVRFNTSSNNTLNGTMSGAGFINTVGAGTTDITTLSHQNYYNLATVYVVPISNASGNSSLYGDATTTFTYQLRTAMGGGSLITDASTSGVAVLSGAPTSTSSVGNYTINYVSGLTLGNERYATINAGNALSWAITARPLTVTASKVYDGSSLFSSGFALSGMVNGDATPTLTGAANTSSINAGNYTSFASSTLSQNNTNYTLTGGAVSATISTHVLNIAVSKTYDSSTLFSRGFTLSGMIGSDTVPSVSGSANVTSSTAGTYTSFTGNSLVLDSGNYTLTGGTVSATITPQPPVVSTVVTTPPPTSIPKPDQPSPALKMPDDNSQPVVPKSENATVSTTVNDSFSPSQNTSKPAETSSVNTQNAASPTSTTSTNNGIVVSLVREPSEQASGVISVAVPKNIMEKSNGFTFALPAQISSKGADSSALTISLVSGNPLPGWIKFNPKDNTFVATNVPSGGLPLSILISTGGKKSTIVISENRSN